MNKRLLILCCHNGPHIVNYKPPIVRNPLPTEKISELQLRTSYEALTQNKYDVLILSGGYTIIEEEKSEARGLYEMVKILGLKTDKPVILEEYARDTFENLLFGMARFYQLLGEFPKEVGACSWLFKGERIKIIAGALRLPNFRFLEVSGGFKLQKLPYQITLEIKNDPLHRRQNLLKKRSERDFWKKGNPYETIPKLQETFQILNQMEKEENPSLPGEFKFPWEK